jgi:hypothetical protein
MVGSFARYQKGKEKLNYTTDYSTAAAKKNAIVLVGNN